MRFRLLGAALVAVLSTAALRAGGWAVITVHHFPDAIVAGVPTDVVFTVRVHGVNLAADLPATAEAIHGAERVAAPVRTGSAKYTAAFTLPHPGDWTLVIHSGYGTSPGNSTRLPITAVSPGENAPAYSASQQGARLFVAKGCMRCHRHAAIEATSASVNIGPTLSRMALEPEHVARTLRNPPPRKGEHYTWMPDLGLREDEIQALTAFLTAAPQATRR